MQPPSAPEDDGWSQGWSSDEDYRGAASGQAGRLGGSILPVEAMSSGSELVRVVDQSGYDRDEEVPRLTNAAPSPKKLGKRPEGPLVKVEESEASFLHTPPAVMRSTSPRAPSVSTPSPVRRRRTPLEGSSVLGKSSSSALGARSPFSGRKSPVSPRTGRRRQQSSGSSDPAPTELSQSRVRRRNDIVAMVFDSLLAVFSIPFRLLGVAISPLSTVLYGSVFVGVLTYLVFISLASLASSVCSYFSLPSVSASPLSIAGLLLKPTQTILTYSVSPLTFLACSALHAFNPPFCPPPKQLPSFPRTNVAHLARSISLSARQASDIFDSVVELGDPGRLGLHQAEIWELGVAVRTSMGLEGKETLAREIDDLGLLTRDVKDSMITINSLGINAFSFIVHEFRRIEDLLQLIHSGSRSYSPTLVSHNLDLLFSRLSSDLTSLLEVVDRAIPLSERASLLGGRVMESLAFEHARLHQVREERPFWSKLADGVGGGKAGFKSRQLARDLELTGVSVVNLKSTRTKLEDARSALVAYRNNAAMFKASLVGYHIADHGLAAEDEIFALRRIMASFGRTVDAAKAQGGIAMRRELAEREEDRRRLAEAVVNGEEEVGRW